MAVALDAVVAGTAAGAVSSASVSLAAGTPTGVIALIHAVDTQSRTITSVTAGSKSLTFVGSEVVSTNRKVWVYHTTATPDTGTQTVTVNFSAAVSHDVVIDAVSVTGGDSTTPAYNFASTTFGGSSTPSLSATNTSTEGALCVATGDGGVSATPGGGQTIIGGASVTMAAGVAFSSYVFGTANPSMSWTLGAAIATAIATVGLKEAGGGGGGALAGTDAMSFTQAGALTGAGALAGTDALTFTESAVLNGLAAIAGTNAMTFTQSATLSGPGSISGTNAITLTESGVLTGEGALAGVDAITLTESGVITGTAQVTGTNAMSFTNTGTMEQPGAISGANALTFTQAGLLAGAGALLGVDAIIFANTGTLTQPYTPTISVTLTDINNVPLGNLTGLDCAWWDEARPNLQTTPKTTATAQTTSASGLLSFTTLTGSGLTAAGQIGWLEVSNSDGDPTRNQVLKVAAGPVAVI